MEERGGDSEEILDQSKAEKQMCKLQTLSTNSVQLILTPDTTWGGGGAGPRA